jgi:hypothetical protein
MAMPHTITRRSAIVGLAALPALAAVVAAPALADTPSAVTAAIAKHKAAMRAIRSLGRREARLETLPDRPPRPAVQIGNMVSWDERGERIKTPIFAYSHEAISAECDRHLPTPWGTEASRQARRVRFEGFHREFTRMVRARVRFDRASGLIECRRQVRDAFAREAEAEAAVLLARPIDAAEGRLKAAYIRRCELLCDWVDCDATTSALLEGLCAPVA